MELTVCVCVCVQMRYHCSTVENDDNLVVKQKIVHGRGKCAKWHAITQRQPLELAHLKLYGINNGEQESKSKTKQKVQVSMYIRYHEFQIEKRKIENE